MPPDLGHTTPARAAETARSLREELAAWAACEAGRLQGIADRLSAGGLPPAEQPSGGRDPLLPPRGSPPDLTALRDAIAAYDQAALRPGEVATIPRAAAVAAKGRLGRHYEGTVLTGWNYVWIEGIQDGDWERRHFSGTALCVEDGDVALGGIVRWQGGCGSSERGIRVVKIADLRQEPADTD
jgi:hypothetical protein